MKLSSLRALMLAFTCVFSLSAFAAPIDLNTATAEQLAQNLNGIGVAKAEAIVEYRTKNGPFTSVDQLTEVKGIGAATVEKNRSNISIQEAVDQKNEVASKK
ncbi:ComEA family DNA-binding protein [Neptuniibacter sp. QD48_55]|uniref:ComEA family DNA-binding protein n=1 Tax=Neptuniibacter sp. QD48_55 TaxID=3398212 RepID=UPI0039F470D7